MDGMVMSERDSSMENAAEVSERCGSEGAGFLSTGGGDESPRSKSRRTSRTCLAVTAEADSPKASSRALSQIEFTRRGMPREAEAISEMASVVNGKAVAPPARSQRWRM